MNIVKTAHAVFLSKDGQFFYWEKNKRYDNNITFFWWKLEKWESHKEWLIRELLEETSLDLSNKILIILEFQESVIINDNNFIWNLYLIHVTKNEVKTLLSNNEWRNIEYPINEIENIPFWFPALKKKLINALKYDSEQ
jgi:8-oxo-dGTP pyrophosphatase MutT (NUDIX family)